MRSSRFGVLLIAFITLMMLLYPAAAQTPITVVLYPESDSLTVFIPTAGNVTLSGLGFQVVINVTRYTFFLEDYEAFSAFRFDAIPTPLCFRLETISNRSPLPRDCNADRTIIQRVSQADVFWYDRAQQNTLTLLLVEHENTLDFCPAGQLRCEFDYIPPALLASPTATITLDPALMQIATETVTPTETSTPTLMPEPSLTLSPTVTPAPSLSLSPTETVTLIPGEPCAVFTTASTVAIRVGPGFERSVRASMTPNEPILVTGVYVDQTNTWWKLLPPDNAAASDVDRFWVLSTDVETQGDCSLVESVAGSPVIYGIASAAEGGVVIAQNLDGNWFYGDSWNVQRHVTLDQSSDGQTLVMSYRDGDFASYVLSRVAAGVYMLDHYQTSFEGYPIRLTLQVIGEDQIYFILTGDATCNICNTRNVMLRE